MNIPKHLMIGALLTMAVTLVGCGKSDTNAPSSATSTGQEQARQVDTGMQDKLAEDTALTNPATVYCLEQGGKFNMGKSFDGSSEGYCILENNITCEVWAHYNGDCPAGSKKNKHNASSTSATQKSASTTSNTEPESDDQTDVDYATGTQPNADTQGLTLSAEPGEEAGEIISSWKTNGIKAPDGFIVMLSGQEQVSYPTKYFHILKNTQSRSFVWNDLVPEKTYFFRVCIADGETCKTYSPVANSVPR